MLARFEWTPVTTLLALVIASTILGAVAPQLLASLALSLPGLSTGALWQPFTWPLANPLSIWLAIDLLMLWLFGNDLLRSIGSARLVQLLVGLWFALTAAFVLVQLVFPTGELLFGVAKLITPILLLWIAENPLRRMMFGIPAWGFGAFILGFQTLSLISQRAFASLLALLLALAFSAVIARRLGMLTDYAWLPGKPSPASHRKTRKTAREQRGKQHDEARLDALLGKISSEGLHSLSQRERDELKKLSIRRRSNR
ncbi:MAG: hypothetical protein CSA64_02930 [Arachnia propionica]|nr:MAG: hypothetical protein CSA64_02930 [Arachnia propionica]